MAELLRQYLRIAFLAGRPQDLPGGAAQMRVGLALAAVTYLLAMATPVGLGRAGVHLLLDLGCTALALRTALAFVGRPGRFEQAFGGLCGASAVVNTAAVPVYASHPAFAGAEASDATLIAGFALLVWSLSVLAHVLRHTFEIRLATSVGAAFVWVVVIVGVLDAVVPPPAPPTAVPDPYGALVPERPPGAVL